MWPDTSHIKLSTQVNNNGLLSFVRGVSQFTPEAFPLSGNLRVIAPFWADVDTRGTGTVWFRSTNDSGLLARTRDEVAAFLNQEGFIPSYLFIATWDRVGYFSQNTDRVGCLRSYVYSIKNIVIEGSFFSHNSDIVNMSPVGLIRCKNAYRVT